MTCPKEEPCRHVLFTRAVIRKPPLKYIGGMVRWGKTEGMGTGEGLLLATVTVGGHLDPTIFVHPSVLVYRRYVLIPEDVVYSGRHNANTVYYGSSGFHSRV